MCIWDMQSGMALRRIEVTGIQSRMLVFLPDGRRCLSCNQDNTVRLWDLDAGSELRRFEGHTATVFAVAASPDGRRAASAGLDRTVRIWDVDTGMCLQKIAASSVVSSLALSPNGEFVLSGGWDGHLRLWNVADGSDALPLDRVGSMSWTQGVMRVMFARDGREVLACFAEPAARIWHIDVATPPRVLQSSEYVWDAAFTPDGRALVGVGGDGIFVWARQAGMQPRVFPESNGLWAAALSEDNRLIVAGGSRGVLRLWDIASGRERSRLEGHKGDVYGLAIDRRGQRLLSGGADR